MDTRTKIINIDEAAARASGSRSNCRDVILAAGSFDILQVPHARFLAGLKSDGAMLIVAVYDDASLCRMRRQSQPVLSERARAQLVAALRAVDQVVIWPGDSLDELIARLRPKGVEFVPEGRNIIGEILDRHK